MHQPAVLQGCQLRSDLVRSLPIKSLPGSHEAQQQARKGHHEARKGHGGQDDQVSVAAAPRFDDVRVRFHGGGEKGHAPSLHWTSNDRGNCHRLDPGSSRAIYKWETWIHMENTYTFMYIEVCV